MDSPGVPDSPPSPYIPAPVVSTLPKPRGRPRGSKGRIRPGDGARVTKSSPIPASRESPDHRATRFPSRASSAVVRRLFQDPDSPSGPQREKTRDGDTIVVDLAVENHVDLERPPTARENEPVVALERSPASAPEVPRTPRPTPTRQSKSEPARIESLSAFQLDSMIAAMIRKPLPEKQRQSQGVGNNYAFEVVTASSGSEKITKIGFTKGPEKRRLSRILYECQHQKIEHEEDPEHVPIRLYDKAEKLALQELSGFRYKFSCNCSVKEHREYFTVRSEVAREVVRRWREFCKQEPYDAEGKLRDFWEHRLRRMRRGEESETIHDHEKRALRWEAFVNPTDLEKIWFEFTQGFDKFWGWRWQGVAFIECCMIVVLSFPSFRAVLFFFGVVSLILAELLGFELPLTVQVVQDNFAKFQQLSRSPSLTISEMDKQNADSPTREIQAGSKSEDKELIPGINGLEDHDSALMDDESDREEKSELSVIVIPDDE